MVGKGGDAKGENDNFLKEKIRYIVKNTGKFNIHRWIF